MICVVDVAGAFAVVSIGDDGHIDVESVTLQGWEDDCIVLRGVAAMMWGERYAHDIIAQVRA